MKVITCASYYGSGSSAVTDLVAEYRDVHSTTNFELSFIYNLDGISDLEFFLVDCHYRRNAGYALKRFERLSRFNSGNILNKRYERFFGGNYGRLTKEYINKLLDLKFEGWGFYDLYDKGGFFYYYVMQGINHILEKIFKKNQIIFKHELTYCSHPSKDYFLKCTQEYTHALLDCANATKAPYLCIDQAVSSQNISRLLRYFKDEVFVIVVMRDPRDIFALERFCWKDRMCPHEDVELFCKWFKYNRESGTREQTKDHVIQVNFEDLVYKYDETVHKIESFTGLCDTDHISMFEKFNPMRSVVNTQVWKKYPINNEVQYIERTLKEYLYDFDNVNNEEIRGKKTSTESLF